MRKLISLALAGGLLVGVMASAQAATKPIFTDPSGDATLEAQSPASLPGGWDITEGAVERKGSDIVFTVKHGDMPPMGSMPEATRFLWNFTVGTSHFRLVVKSADLGKPDPFTQSGTERIGRVDAQGHFRLEGECATDPGVGVGVQFVNCPVIGYYTGSFDPATMSFSATIPMKDLKAKPGSKIGPGTSQICTICWVTHTAERSLDATIIDSAAQTASYKIPR